MNNNPLNEMIEKVLRQWDDKKARCIATDGDYTDKEMAQILSDTLKRNYEEDRKFIADTLLSFARELREKTGVENKVCGGDNMMDDEYDECHGWNDALSKLNSQWQELLGE